MKKFSKLMLLAMLFASTSCGFMNPYVVNYSISLASVESPLDAKRTFGDTKVVSLDDDGFSKYRFEDDYIEITWAVTHKNFLFELKNKTEYTIKINWDDVCYVDVNGKAGRVMHSGVKYIDRNSSQPATIIPKGASISDLLLPTDNVSYGGGWSEKPLIEYVYYDEAMKNTIAPTYVGKQMSVIMPILIENVQNEYIFVFNIDGIIE